MLLILSWRDAVAFVFSGLLWNVVCCEFVVLLLQGLVKFTVSPGPHCLKCSNEKHFDKENCKFGINLLQMSTPSHTLTTEAPGAETGLNHGHQNFIFAYNLWFWHFVNEWSFLLWQGNVFKKSVLEQSAGLTDILKLTNDIAQTFHYGL